MDSVLFITPRRIYLTDASGVVIKDSTKYLERPLRASTLQGDRIALARSQMVDAGTVLKFTVSILKGAGGKSWANITPDKVESCLEYGSLKGLGHWRGGGYGRFTYAKEAL